MTRLFVIDPVCAMLYGHSLNALSYFADMASTYVPDTYKIASRHLPQTPANDIVRYFDFHYDFALKIERLAEPTRDNRSARPLDAEGISSQEFYEFLGDFAVSDNDILLFPSIDYYSLIGLLNALRGLPRNRHPKLMLRFIGVMEQAHQTLAHTKTMEVAADRIREALSWKTPISLCAETPKYARRLEEVFGARVLTVPYFAPAVDALPMPLSGPCTFLMGGAARADKGFFRLADIISRVNSVVNPSEVSFIIQGPPKDVLLANAEYMKRLWTLPNVEMLESTLPYAEIVESFRRSHVALMPYMADTYEYRGSAMLMEALMFNRPAICQAGTAFAEQASIYGCGEICADDEEFSRAIERARLKPAPLMAEQAMLSRSFYLQDVQKSCDQWFEGSLN